MTTDSCEKEKEKVDAALAKYGLHPRNSGRDEPHHTEMPLNESDKDLGELGWYLGGLFVDVTDYRPDTPVQATYWYSEMTSVDVWQRVARALRVHGLKIVDDKQ
jgi:hypothetical protein